MALSLHFAARLCTQVLPAFTKRSPVRFFKNQFLCFQSQIFYVRPVSRATQRQGTKARSYRLESLKRGCLLLNTCHLPRWRRPGRRILRTSSWLERKINWWSVPRLREQSVHESKRSCLYYTRAYGSKGPTDIMTDDTNMTTSENRNILRPHRASSVVLKPWKPRHNQIDATVNITSR